MFVPRYLLHRYSDQEAARCRERWEQDRDKETLVFRLIREGAGEDFLQADVERGELAGFLDDQWDLKGLNLFQEELDFPDGDSFESIDFRYSKFWHSTFKNALFAAYLDYCSLYNCKFVGCIFAMGSCFGTVFRKCNFERCDFARNFTFTNCDFVDCRFESFSVGDVLFSDCRFDAETTLAEPDDEAFRAAGGYSPDGLISPRAKSSYYGGIEAAYESGRVPEQRRQYHYLARDAFGRFNAGGLAKLSNRMNKYVAGYGVRPSAPIRFGGFAAILFTAIYVLLAERPWTHAEALQTVRTALVTSMNAFAGLPLDDNLVADASVLIGIERMLGVIMLSVFVTVLANLWFRFRD